MPCPTFGALQYCAQLAALLAVGSCSFGQNPDLPEERTTLLTSFAEDMLFPRYERTFDALGALELASEELCADASNARLDVAKRAWDTARSAWKESEVFAFGPYKKEPLRLGPKIDSWPVRPESIDELLDGDGVITTEVLSNSGVFLRGFPVLEYLLYTGDPDVTSAFASDSRRCEYLIAATSDAQSTIGELRAAWSTAGGNYVGSFAAADVYPGEFDDSLDALSEVVDRLGFTAENAHAEKLTPALGAGSPTGPDATLVESQFSGRATSDIADSLRGIEALFYGDLEGTDGALGLNTYLAFYGHNFDEELRVLLNEAHSSLSAIGLPLGQAIRDQPFAVQTAIESLKDVQRFLQGTVTPALNFSVGFNDTDGD